ncbi:MAG: hypothetical protein GJ680_10225 [Alteromonadaceae bacterium]|nr:hypothetical protein [Alteromonadaceae bacterium]
MRANFAFLFFALLLTGCGGGSSGANGENPFNGGTTPTLALSIVVLDSDCSAPDDNSFPADQNICVQATLTSDGAASANQVVSFALSGSIGELTASTALTNSEGVAEIFISNPNLTTGATTITATFDSATDSVGFEYVESDAVTGTQLSIVILDSTCTTEITNSAVGNTELCVEATLSVDGQNIQGEVISFTIAPTIGELSAQTALTDTQGVATIAITNPTLQTGAATVTATYNAITSNASYEYIPGTTSSPSLNLSMLVDGAENNRFRVSESATVNVQFLDESQQPVSDLIINFSASNTAIGITPTSALTDNNGRGSTVLTATSSELGAHTFTASTTYNGTAVSASFNFEITSGTGGGEDSVVLALELRDGSCTTVAANATFGTNETICAVAVLTENTAPVSGEIVEFALSNSLSSLGAASALTDSNGAADVIISNTAGNVGAATVTATFGTLSDSINYEFVAVEDSISPSPTLTSSMIVNDLSDTTFQAGTEALLRALVLNADGSPSANAIVNFSLQGTGPVISPVTALTSESGIAETMITATESDLGAYAVLMSTTVEGTQISDSINIAVSSSGTTIEGDTKFGHFASDGVTFVDGIIGSSLAEYPDSFSISAGATTGFNVVLVDENNERITTPASVTFTSTCVARAEATIDQTVTTINGEASATFEDVSCAGANGNVDTVAATVVVNNTTFTATREFSINGEAVGAISFISATPTDIVLAGTGGQNNASVSTVTFQVNGELGNPLAQQEVSFVVNTNAGGLSIDPLTGLTNSAGQVSTRVTAGTVPTPVRVTASVTTESGNEIQTQSDLLTVNTGLPDQNGFGIGVDVLNPEAADISGRTVTIIARLADSFNNQVPNGTTVNFIAEAGIVDGNCSTGENAQGTIDPEEDDTGTCSVTWTSTGVQPDDHRVTILAYAIGHETLYDLNGNNSYDGSTIDGPPVNASNLQNAGFGIVSSSAAGFIDMSEAWIDEDEDGTRDDVEFLLDYDNNGSFSTADGNFNGPQCSATDAQGNIDTNACGVDSAATIQIRRALVLVTSSSESLWRVYQGDVDDGIILFTNDDNITPVGSLTMAEGETVSLNLVYYDTAEQVMPFGTEVGLLDAEGTIAEVLDTVNNTIQRDNDSVPGSVISLGIVSNTTTDTNGQIEFTYAIDSPGGTRTDVAFVITKN